MNRSTTVAGVVLAVALAYPAASWYLGKRVEEISTVQLREQLSAMPHIKIVRSEYKRSLFNATQTVTTELPASLLLPGMTAIPVGQRTGKNSARIEAGEQAEKLEGAAADSLGKLIQVTVTADISHGPFPDFKTLGAASAEIRVSFDAETQKMINAAFADKPPLTASTLFGFSGGGHSMMHIAAFRYSAPKEDGSGEYAFSGEAMEWQVDFARGFKHYTVSGKAPHFELIDDAKLVISGLALSGKQQRVFDDDPLFYAGKYNFSAERIEVVSLNEKTPPLRMRNLSIKGETPTAGEFIDMVAKIGIDEFKIGEQNYAPVHYDLSFRRLNARKLAAFYHNLSDSKHLPVSQAMLASIQLLMLDNAEFAIDRLSFNTPHGETRISARIKLNDATKEDWRNPLTLIGKLDLTADLNVPEVLLTRLITNKTQNSGDGEDWRTLAQQRTFQQQLERLIAQGYIMRVEGILKSKIEFRSGKLLCNDKPFNLFGNLPG